MRYVVCGGRRHGRTVSPTAPCRPQNMHVSSRGSDRNPQPILRKSARHPPQSRTSRKASETPPVSARHNMQRTSQLLISTFAARKGDPRPWFSLFHFLGLPRQVSVLCGFPCPRGDRVCLEYAVTVAVLDSKRIFSIYFFFRISDIFYIVGGKLNLWTTGASPIWETGWLSSLPFFLAPSHSFVWELGCD